MALRRGAAAAEEEAKKARTNFGRAEYFKLKDGERTTFRLIDAPEDWPFTNQHAFVPTKGAPPDADEKTKASWPKRMGAVCRKDPAFKDQYNGDCYNCTQIDDRTGRPFKAPVRVWARMVIREPVAGTQKMVDDGLILETMIGKTVGFQNVEVEEDETDKEGKETGKKIRHPKIVVANLALDNFFGALQGFADVYAEEGGILNRDITVTRHGEGTETEYKFAPHGVTAGFDLADPKTKAEYETYAAQAHLSEDDLEKLISDLASDEYYARFFDPTKPFPKSKKKSDGEGDSAGAPAAQQEKPVEDPATQDALQAMRDRVRGGNAAPATAGSASGFTPA